MRLFRLNAMVLALVFSVLIEGINTGLYYWLATSFSTPSFASTLCDVDLIIHRPAAKLAQLFYPPSHWPGVGAHILYYTFDLCECWILAFAVIWIFRHFYWRPDDKSRAA